MKLMMANAGRTLPMQARLDKWDAAPPTAALKDRKGRHDIYEIDLTLESGDPASTIFDRAASLLFRYQIYPRQRMRALVCTPDGLINKGALIIQRIFFGPVAIEGAVRVEEVFRNRNAQAETGFSYVTLQGHAENGLATFLIHRTETGAVKFRIESWSLPGSGLGSLMAPLSRILQKRFTLEATKDFLLSSRNP